MRKYLNVHYLPKRGATCLLCNASLIEQEAISSLEEDTKSSFERKDVCLSCHEKLQALEAYWRSQNKEEPKENDRRSFDTKVLDLVKQSVTTTGEVAKEALFLVVHLLRRKMVRLVEKQELEGRTLGIFEILSTKERFLVDLLEPLEPNENLINTLMQ